jgi:Tannase and feruloyl esterase
MEFRPSFKSFFFTRFAWSFFEGCSNGGREALMEAQRFPEDYQGVLAGAPSISTTHVLASGLYSAPASPASYVSTMQIQTDANTILTNFVQR